MPVTTNHLETSGNETDLDSYDTGSISPTGDRLVLAAVHSVLGGGPAAPTLSGNGITWVEIDSVIVSARRTTLFRGMVSSPSSGAVTIDFDSNTQTRCIWSIAEFIDVDTGGANGADAVVQSTNNTDTSVETLAVTLGAFTSASNATYGAFGKSPPGDFTQGSGFTILGQKTDLPGDALISEWKNSNDTSVDISWTGSGDVGGIAVEIKAAVTSGFFAIL